MIVNAGLFLTAVVLTALLAPIGIVFTLIAAIGQGSISKVIGYLSATLLAIALGIDILANCICRDVLNNTMRTAGGYPFGKQGETISRALGKNKAQGTLSKAGKGLADLLNAIQANHVELAAKENNQ